MLLPRRFVHLRIPVHHRTSPDFHFFHFCHYILDYLYITLQSQEIVLVELTVQTGTPDTRGVSKKENRYLGNIHGCY
jgi:hypothetical protein